MTNELIISSSSTSELVSAWEKSIHWASTPTILPSVSLPVEGEAPEGRKAPGLGSLLWRVGQHGSFP